VKVVKGDSYSVYVYPEDHAPPHCHIRYKNDEAESVVGLPLLNLITGKPIPRAVRKALIENINELSKIWEQLNPNKQKL